jgi:hypothetical protein
MLFNKIHRFLFISFIVLLLYPTHITNSQVQHKVFLPTVSGGYTSPFGAEIFPGTMAQEVYQDYVSDLGVQWIRIGALYWRQVQAEEDAPFNEQAMARMDKDIENIHKAGLEPIIIVHGSPAWATINKPFPTACGAIREDKFEDFGKFLEWAVKRYKGKVKYWEIGNEPDIDPSLVSANQVFGCWGDIKDPYYGGEYFGKMLRYVAPIIRKTNPEAKIIMGGLALDTPQTTNPDLGKPEKFFEGVLRSGAADSFDIVGFHSYPWYWYRELDYDYDADTRGPWKELGGFTVGKAKFLRDIMTKYGVNKPLFLNETALVCPAVTSVECPNPDFYESQVHYLTRMLARGLYSGIEQFGWYTLDWPGFRYGSLLNKDKEALPVYKAYKVFIDLASTNSRPEKINVYDRDDTYIEAYRFTKSSTYIDILWGRDLSTYYVLKPQGFLKAYDTYGEEIKPIGPYIPVSFGAVYIETMR